MKAFRDQGFYQFICGTSKIISIFKVNILEESKCIDKAVVLLPLEFTIAFIKCNRMQLQ
jgi:hypothetical protein